MQAFPRQTHGRAAKGEQEHLLINTPPLGGHVNIRGTSQEESLPVVAANPRKQHSTILGHTWEKQGMC